MNQRTTSVVYQILKLAAIAVCLGLFSSPVLAGYCSKYPGGRATLANSRYVLEGVQKELIQATYDAEASLSYALNCFKGDTSKACVWLQEKLYQSIKDRLYKIKMSEALANKQSSLLPRLSYNAILNMIKEDGLHPEQVAAFDQSKHSYSPREKTLAMRLWQTMILSHISGDIEKAGPMTKESCITTSHRNLGEAPINIRKTFQQAVRNEYRINPLLAFLDPYHSDDPREIVRALEKLIDFNREFRRTVSSYKTDHPDSLFTQAFLLLKDHEMGLVNFEKTAEDVIAALPEHNRADACASWDSLVHQQSRRVVTSVGVGFTTAVVCGVGIWTAVGTVPAAAACSFAVADGIIGATRGYKDSKTNYLSGYAGRILNDEANMDNEIRSLREASDMQTASYIVTLVNALGLIPIVNGVKAVKLTKGTRGSLRSLAGLPVADTSVSAIEVNAIHVSMLLKEMAKSSDLDQTKLLTGYADVFDYQSRCDRLMRN